MKQIRMILVGGFLGSGKTTLLASAATRLIEQGNRVGLITNDQAADLVDTALLRQANLDVREIAGGCFCCRFGQLVETADQIAKEISPDVIIGEPVGSCTDLSATVLQPIKDLHANAYRLAPLSVLVDPDRLRDVLDPRRRSAMHPSALYILRKQLEEADLIVINKQDRLDVQARQELAAATVAAFSGKPVYVVSALTGEGVGAWLDAVMRDDQAGRRIVDVDYDIYAEGEAALGWLNASATLTAQDAVDWRAWSLNLLDHIQQATAAHNAQIAHVKLSLTAERGQIAANLTSTSGLSTIRGQISPAATSVMLVVNARVEVSAATLRSVVESALAEVSGGRVIVNTEQMRSLSPGRPVPTHRYASVV
ncbi:MAG: GTP-binding protein [Capsulimonadaceae bacterium]|nr:GTP-binding protein [Capsulimonadaceae bacterium]